MPLIQESLETSLQQNFSNIVGSEQTSSNFDDFDRKSSFFLCTTFWAKVWEEGCCRLSSSQNFQTFIVCLMKKIILKTMKLERGFLEKVIF